MLEDFCTARGVANVEFVEEVGGGLNSSGRSSLQSWTASKLGMSVDHCAQGSIGAFRVSLVRALLRRTPNLQVLDQVQLSPEQDMLQDLLTIAHCFSARLYGLRNYCKKLNAALAADIR